MSQKSDIMLAFRDITKILKGVADTVQTLLDDHNDGALEFIDYLWHMLEYYRRLDPPARGPNDDYDIDFNLSRGTTSLRVHEPTREEEASRIQQEHNALTVPNTVTHLTIEALKAYSDLPPLMFAEGMRAVSKAQSVESKRVAHNVNAQILFYMVNGCKPKAMKQQVMKLLICYLALYMDACTRETDGLERILSTLNQMSYQVAKSSDLPLIPKWERTEEDAQAATPEPAPKKTTGKKTQAQEL